MAAAASVFLVSAAFDTFDPCLGQEARPVAQDCVLHYSRGLFVFSRQDMRPAFE